MLQALRADQVLPLITWAELTEQRGFLVNFARRRLLDPALAEDAVHDAFEAVMTGRASFGGRAALRTWLAGIVKHKIVDLLRGRACHASLDTPSQVGDDELQVIETPLPGPQEQAEHRQRLRHTLACISSLPPGLRMAVEMRLVYDRSTVEVCRTLAISPDNLAVRLHRARKQLMSWPTVAGPQGHRGGVSSAPR